MVRPVGEVDLQEEPEMKYREKPQQDWEMNSKGFFYLGLNAVLPYSNIVRALKENIYTYSLLSEHSDI